MTDLLIGNRAAERKSLLLKRRQINIRKLISVLLFSFIFELFYILDVNAKEAGDGKLIITSDLFEQNDPAFQEPPSEYMDETGKKYLLSSWQTIQYPDEMEEIPVEKELIYQSLEAIDELPQTADLRVYNKYQGTEAVSSFPALETECIREVWEEGLSLPVTYHQYHSDAYQLGEYLIMPDADKPELDGYESVLLAMAGLPDTGYHITEINWDGEPYLDESNVWCRDAVATGEKCLRDYRVLYGGTAVLEKPGKIQWEAEYQILKLPEKESEIKPETKEYETAAYEDPIDPPAWKQRLKQILTITFAVGALLAILWLIAAAVIFWEKKREDHEENN